MGTSSINVPKGREWHLMIINQKLPSGKLPVCELENGPVEIVDVPILNGGFP